MNFTDAFWWRDRRCRVVFEPTPELFAWLLCVRCASLYPHSWVASSHASPLCVCLLGSPSLVGEGCAATCAPRATCCRPLPPLHRQRAEGAASVRKGNHGSHALQLVSDWLSSDVMSRYLRKWRRRVRANLPIGEVKSTSWFPHTPASKFACVEIFVKSYAQIHAWTQLFSSCLVFWFVTRK